MNTTLLDVLGKRFPGKFLIKVNNGVTFVTFSAKSPEFGEMVILEETPGSFILYFGNFTHCHLDLLVDAEDEVELAHRIADLLDDVFDDRIICHGAHQTGGGYASIEYFREFEDTEYFTWSGRYEVSRKPLVKYKHWYTEPHDYADDRERSLYDEEQFWLDSDDELIVKIARVYAIDEFAFTQHHTNMISKIIKMLIASDECKPGYFFSDTEGIFELWYSFEPVGIQIGGQLKLVEFEDWEFMWHNLLELSAFPYRYDDVPDFTY